MGKLLETLGFSDNPFASYVAENEPDIDQYFIRPPYYDAVTDRGRATRSLMLFGARGAGKSATRLTFYKNSWLEWQESQSGPLVVTLDDYGRILADGLAKANLERFVVEVGYLVVEAVLLWLAALEENMRTTYVDSMTPEEEAIVIPLVRRFYLSRPEFMRSASIREPLKLLNQAWHKRTKLWMSEKWDSVSRLVGTIAQAIAKRSTSLDANISGDIESLLKSEPKLWNDGQYARAVLTRLADFAKVFGFNGVTILVDKLDETQQTNNSAHTTAELIYPILSTTQLLEIEGFGWVFFLWDKVREEYNTQAMPVRLDKIANATIQWEDGLLRDLVKRRLQHFSNNTICDFSDTCDTPANSDAFINDIIKISMKSPR